MRWAWNASLPIFSVSGDLDAITRAEMQELLVDVVHLPAAWRAKGWGFWRKARHTAAVAAYVFAALLLWTWNLVGWKL